MDNPFYSILNKMIYYKCKNCKFLIVLSNHKDPWISTVIINIHGITFFVKGLNKTLPQICRRFSSLHLRDLYILTFISEYLFLLCMDFIGVTLVISKYLSRCRQDHLSYLSICHSRIIHLGNSDCGWQFWSISQCGYCCPCTNLKKCMESN